MIITLKPGFDASSDVRKLGGKLGRQARPHQRTGARTSERGDPEACGPSRRGEHPLRPSDRRRDESRRGDRRRARRAAPAYGYTGAGVGVAVIDSGITTWHDDLTYHGVDAVPRRERQRVAAFVDFVNGRTLAVRRQRPRHARRRHHRRQRATTRSACAPASRPSAHLVSLKVLDRNGRGVISNVIAALDWVVANKAAYNIRVVNLSVGAAVHRVVQDRPADAGGQARRRRGHRRRRRRPATSARTPTGRLQYGGITAPGNAPWVLTVGASSHEGTRDRAPTT